MWSGIDCTPAGFNIATTSGHYAGMAGVLAGFAFTALVVLLTPTQVQERRAHPTGRTADVFLTFLAAFVALIVSTLTYSVLAGENIGEARGRAATQELIDGLPFGLAVVMLFHGLTLLVGRDQVKPLSLWTARAFTAVVGPSLTMFYLVDGTTDTEAARAMYTGLQCANASPYRLGLGLTIVMMAMLACVLAGLGRFPNLLRWAKGGRDVAPIVVVALSAVSAVVSGDLATRAPKFLLSPAWTNVYIVIAWAALTIIGLLLMTAYDPAPPATATAPVIPPPRSEPAIVTSPTAPASDPGM